MTIKKLLNISLLFLLIIGASSCIPQRKIIYFQDKSDKKNYENPYHPAEKITETYQIRTNDYLFIRVMTDDKDLMEYYNLSGGSNGGMSMGSSGGGGSKYSSYMVDDDGNIDFPNVGLVNVGGLTRKEAKLKLQEILSNHITDFTIQVHLSNTHFTVLGEAGAGNHQMIKDQMTIWEALAETGDLQTYSKRKEVKIIRPMPDGKSQIYTVDLTDLSLLDSQESYIYPNDIIYVEPLKAKMWGFGEVISLGVVTTLISAYYIFFELLTK